MTWFPAKGGRAVVIGPADGRIRTIEKGGTRHQHGGLTIRPEPRSNASRQRAFEVEEAQEKAAGIPAVTS